MEKTDGVFISGVGEIESVVRTTQGDPLTMATYGVGNTSLFISSRNKTNQVAFADDLSSVKKLIHLRARWNTITTYGLPLGYFSNASKTWIVIKPLLHYKATQIFDSTGMKIMIDGGTHLGGFIGLQEAEEQYGIDKIRELTNQVLLLTNIAKAEPHAAYAGFIKGF